MSIGTFFAVLFLLIIAVLLVGVLVLVVVDRQLRLSRETTAQATAQAADLAIRVVNETVGSIGPLVAREVGDQIRGYPMAGLEPQGDREQDLPETPSWYGQATRDDDPDDWLDPTDGRVEEPTDWSPEARVAAASEMPEVLRTGLGEGWEESNGS